jgi:hypothetical protein
MSLKMSLKSIKLIAASFACAAALVSLPSNATGLATCKSGPESDWQPQAKLQKELEARGWTVRRIKVDGGCYEVYAVTDKGERVEAYFHPVTFDPVFTSKR